jgi:hypothetical protein
MKVLYGIAIGLALAMGFLLLLDKLVLWPEAEALVSDPNFTETQYQGILRRLSELETEEGYYWMGHGNWTPRIVANEKAIEYLQNLNYDPNDPIYKFIPEADPSWIKEFGDNERVRLIHSISELRVVVANMGKRLLELEKEPNEVKE